MAVDAASCSPRTTCSTCGCRCRTRSARCCSPRSSRPARPPRSTAGSTGSSTTWPWSRRRSWPPRRASSRRCTAGSSRWPRRRAARASKIFDWAMGVGREVSQARAWPAGRRAPLLKAKHAVADRLVFTKLRARFGGRLRFLVSRQRRAVAGRRGVLPRRRHPDPRGLRAHRDQRRHLRQPARPLQVRHGRAAVPGHRGPDRRRRRGPAARSRRDARLPRPARADRRGARRATAGCAPATSASSTPTASCGSPTARRTSSRPPAASTSRRRPSRSCSRRSAPLASQIVVHGDGRNYCTALITLDEDALTQWAEHRGVSGDLRRARPATPTCRPRSPASIDAINARLNRWETIKTFRILDRDLTHRGRRADAEPEGEAQGGRAALRPRGDSRRCTPNA